MNERLKKYFDSLFEGAPDTKEIGELKEEIFLNTLDRYNDLLAQGKSEEASFTQAIARIGDVDELISLCNIDRKTTGKIYYSEKLLADNKKKRDTVLLITIALYFVCVLIPIAFYDISTLFATVFMVIMIAATTGLAVYGINLKIDAEGYSRLIDSIKLTKNDDYSVEDFEKKRKIDNIVLSSSVSLFIAALIPYVVYMNVKSHGNIAVIMTLILLAAAVTLAAFYRNKRFNIKQFSSGTMVNEFKKWNKLNKKARPLLIVSDFLIYFTMTILFVILGIRTGDWAILLISFLIAFVLTRIVRQLFELVKLVKK